VGSKIPGHLLMLGDRVRMDAYRRAIHEVVRPGDVVADVGTGSGILAFFAAQAGAIRIYAFEAGDVIEEARALAQRNGFAERIVFMQGMSDRLKLPERADVIVSEILGSFGLDENVLRFNLDARKRFLKPGGRLLPSALDLFLVPVESETLWKRAGVGLMSEDFYGLDFSTVRRDAASHRHNMDCSRGVAGLASPARIAQIDFIEVADTPPVYRTTYVVEKPGRLHGLVGYFRATLAPGIVLSTAPENEPTHWKQTFFPLENEVEVHAGDEIRCQITSIPYNDLSCWEWKTDVNRGGTEIARFSQSNLKVSKIDFIVGRTDFRPVLTSDGEIQREILSLCDGERSMREIAETILAAHPERYTEITFAMREAIDIVRRVAQT
jgi:SAM-dependent methyltransferase